MASHRHSQTVRILAHLRSGHTLTALEALEKFGCMRLGGRIYDLRERHGIVAHKETIKLPNGKHVAQYSLPALLV